MVLIHSFSQWSTEEYLVFRKTESCETENHLLCGWSKKWL
ncbi:hypothetical protein CLOSTMETH_03726 [[Clostridium] methylpentosum DSM 5476]|uniref:Uncharacterized protein n=1 Tax=[Clostridium] methylpentosum DSM 5476 TaxID=537013 RepID=C0EIN1_9FIRM|nr:hypothetical protein CLOSTMETH_03726 [[Clostridium] methylpentosum DSM 5476]